MKQSEIESAAAALYDGLWRSTDRNELMAEYNLDPDDADAICDELNKIELQAQQK